MTDINLYIKTIAGRRRLVSRSHYDRGSKPLFARQRLVWLASAIWLSVACPKINAWTVPASFPAKGNIATATKRVIESGRQERYYFIQPVAGTGKYPVVVLLHGGGTTARLTWRITSLPTLARRDRFIIVMPQGVGNMWQIRNSIDIEFLKAVIRDVIKNYQGDPRNIFMTGFSAGGLMTIHFVCAGGAGLLRVAGVGSATIAKDQAGECKETKPLPWFEFHGDRDPIVPFNGGWATIPPQILRQMQRSGVKPPVLFRSPLLSAAGTFNFFADRAGCRKREVRTDLPHMSKNDPSTAETVVRSGCVGGTESIFYIFHNAGHTLPGMPSVNNIPGSGQVTNEDVDAGTILGEFFEQAINR